MSVVTPEVRDGSPPRLLEEEAPDVVRGKRVLVIDDVPTLMHGGIAFGAGYSLVKQLKDVIVADHHPWHIQKVPPPQGGASGT